MSEPSPIRSLPQVIDPLAPCPPGRYDDHLVSVLRAAPSRGGTADRRRVIRTPLPDAAAIDGRAACLPATVARDAASAKPPRRRRAAALQCE